MKAASPSSAAASEALADDLAIRFVNTAAWRLRSEVEERLVSPEALLHWMKTNGLLGNRQLAVVQRGWKRDVELAHSFYGSAIALREVIYNLLSARISGTAPAAADLKAFNAFLFRHDPGTSIAWHTGGYGWQATTTSDAGLLMPIGFSAAELLTGMTANKIRQCQDDRGCGWLFVDESRTGNRRWCSMGDCGNRAKAHRHYERVKHGKTVSPKTHD